MNTKSRVGRTRAIELRVAESWYRGFFETGREANVNAVRDLETVIYGEGAVKLESQNLPQFWQGTSS
jgi:hypothetical protein